MGCHQFPGDGQAKPGADPILGPFAIDPVKTVENKRQPLWRDSRSIILDRNPHPVIPPGERHRDGQIFFRTVSNRIADNVTDRLVDSFAIDMDRTFRRQSVGVVRSDLFFCQFKTEFLHQIVHEVPDGDGFKLKFKFLQIQFGEGTGRQ